MTLWCSGCQNWVNPEMHDCKPEWASERQKSISTEWAEHLEKHPGFFDSQAQRPDVT